MQKLIVPELPSVAEIAFLPFNQFALNSDKSPRAFALGAIKMRDEYATKHREAAVVAVEALEEIRKLDRGFLSDGSAYPTIHSVKAHEAIEKIKKIYEQMGE